jgi:transcriptional regulator with XRE-family HTH domain
LSWLKNKRINKGLTQNQVAEKCEISRSYYTHIENGTKVPTVNVAKQIGKTLNFNWTIFFKEECSSKEQRSTIETYT